MKTAEDILKEKTARIISVSPETSLKDVIEQMVEMKIGAMLVKEGERVVGIWTERDLLKCVLSPGFDIAGERIADHMKTDLYTTPAKTPITRLQEMFIGLFIRHILVIKDETVIGMISIGDIMRALLLEKDKEIRDLNKIASWEYYENWGWHHKYRQADAGQEKPSDR